MSVEKISIQNAKSDKLFYVVADGIVYRESDKRCLILKRDMREKVHPGKWATVGGKLEHRDLDLTKPSRTEGDVFVFEDAVFELLKREIKEEAGISVKLLPKFVESKVIVRPDGIPVLILHFAVRYGSGEVKPEPGSFTEFAWVNADEAKDYDCIEDIGDAIKSAIKIFGDKDG